MGKLIFRNVSLYFRDRVSVFFSLMSVLIVILLYVFFLSNVQVQSISQQMGGVVNENDIAYLINTWVLAGLLSIMAVTTTLGALGFMVSDRENKIIMDFKSSPLSIWSYPLAGVISALLVGLTVSIMAFVIYGIYMVLTTGYFFSIMIILKTMALILFSTIMSSALMGLMVSFVSSNSAFSSLSLIIGTSIGFVNGLYIAIGQLPEKVQMVIKFLPFSHIAALFRQVMMEDSIPIAFASAPIEVIETYKEMFGVVLKWNNENISVTSSLVFILLVFILSLLLFFVNFRRKRDVI